MQFIVTNGFLVRLFCRLDSLNNSYIQTLQPILLKRRLIFLLFLSSFSFLLRSQTTTEGKDFWMGFMENIHSPPDAPAVLELSFSAKETANVTVEGPLSSYYNSFVVPFGQTTKIEVPLNSFMPTVSGKTGMGIHIVSDVDISVYALNKRILSADAAVILPTNALGNEYVAMSHSETMSLESLVLVVATANDTQIEIIPSQNLIGGESANFPFVINLNQGETYQLKSEGDLSGTRVSAISTNEENCKNFAVFGGSKLTFVGDCGANGDHLFEQMFPTSTWGQNFLYVPYESRLGGDLLKVVAKDNNTIVEVEGEPTINLSAGEVRVISKALDGVRNISANKPISMAQYARSQDCDNRPGDPFMILLSPMEQRIRNVTFEAFEAFEIEQYYLTLITIDDQVESIILDGDAVGGLFTRRDGKAYASFTIEKGNHTVSAPAGVIAYVYGFGNIESFGYSAGVSLVNTNLKVAIKDAQMDIVDENSCFGITLTINALFNIDPSQPDPYIDFAWDFGDGNTGTGEEVQHQYDQPGTYEITLVASDGTGACSTQEVIKREVNVVAFELSDIIGPQSVCPDVSDVSYTALAEGAEEYEWSVSGGIIQGSTTGESVVVNWGISNPDASVSVIVRNSLGCMDEFELPVIVNLRLEPEIPQGAELLCFTDRDGKTYRTITTNGSTYQWFVEGGSFDGDSMGTEVTVNWEGVGMGRIWFIESNPSITDCFGTSPVLEVEVKEEITISSSITNVSCANGNDGSITLSVEGGLAPYSYQWNTAAPVAGQNVLADLEAGTYSVVIIDALGCEFRQDFEVEQPTPLLVEVAVMNVSCHDGSDGEATALISGGTAPYALEWNGLVPQEENVITRQQAGNYSLRVLDANGCEFIIGYEIDQPEPLTATTTDNPSCPGESTGSILVQASGGTAPYFYRWNTSPPQDQQLIVGLPAGKYSVTVTDANGCVFTTDTPEITERLPVINVPNAFTPNGDGMNDGFSIISDCSLEVFEMKIYNSWGLMVFHTSSLAELWDGSYQGERVPTGKYTYHIAYKTSLNGQPIEDTMIGGLTLLR